MFATFLVNKVPRRFQALNRTSEKTLKECVFQEAAEPQEFSSDSAGELSKSEDQDVELETKRLECSMFCNLSSRGTWWSLRVPHPLCPVWKNLLQISAMFDVPKPRQSDLSERSGRSSGALKRQFMSGAGKGLKSYLSEVATNTSDTFSRVGHSILVSGLFTEWRNGWSRKDHD